MTKPHSYSNPIRFPRMHPLGRNHVGPSLICPTLLHQSTSPLSPSISLRCAPAHMWLSMRTYVCLRVCLRRLQQMRWPLRQFSLSKAPPFHVEGPHDVLRRHKMCRLSLDDIMSRSRSRLGTRHRRCHLVCRPSRCSGGCAMYLTAPVDVASTRNRRCRPCR